MRCVNYVKTNDAVIAVINSKDCTLLQDLFTSIVVPARRMDGWMDGCIPIELNVNVTVLLRAHRS